MKRYILTILMVFTAVLAANAQERHIKVYSGGQAVYSSPTTGSNRLSFSGQNAVFSHNGTEWSTAVNSIDSLVFTVGDNDDTTGGSPVETDTANAVYITWNGSNVSIINPLSSQGVSVSNIGGNVTVTSTIDMAYVPYILSGSSQDGSLTINSAKKVYVYLDGLSLTSTSGPAILMADDHKMLVELNDSNTLVDNASSSGKGVIQAAGKLAIQGTGTLTVSGMAKHAIQSSGKFEMTGGTVNVLTAVKDGFNVDDFSIYGGTINIPNPNGDGIDGDQGIVEIFGGDITVNCTGNDAKGITCDSTMTIAGGNITVTMSGDAAKALKTKSNLIIGGGTVNLTVTGSHIIGTDSNGDTDYSYATGAKVDGNMFISGGQITANCSQRAFNCDGNYLQAGGSVTVSTSAAGFTISGTGTSCTDGFAASCLKADGTITFTAGSFNGQSTGKGGRGIVGDSTLTVGTPGAADSLLHIYVTTSGSAVNASSGGWPGGGGSSSDYWKGLPKGVKIEGNITINSGHLQSYCSQTSGSTTGEAIESKDSIFINGGYVEANAYDDAINAGIYLSISGGHVWGYSRGNDGIDCNGTRIDISGGTVIGRGSEVAVDDNGDHGGRIYISGGTIILIGGNMGTTEATPTITNQKGTTISSGSSWGGGGGSSTATNGFCIKNMANDSIILVFKWTNFSGNGFVTSSTGHQSTNLQFLEPIQQNNAPKPPGGGGSGIFVSSPDLQAGNTYRSFTSPTINGGTDWHGLYSGATVTTSGSGTQLTLQ